MVFLHVVEHVAKIVIAPEVAVEGQFGLQRHSCAGITASSHGSISVRAVTSCSVDARAIGDVWRRYWRDVLGEILGAPAVPVAERQSAGCTRGERWRWRWWLFVRIGGDALVHARCLSSFWSEKLFLAGVVILVEGRG